MKTYLTVRGYSVMLALALLITVSLFLSCNKIDTGSYLAQNALPPGDLSAKTISSVSGFVTGETDEPVAGATVFAGTATTTTDSYGYFELNNVSVTANAAVVTILKKGYFNGIKTYVAAANPSAFFRIKLMPKTNAGSVDADTGGNIVIKNGMGLSFPADFVIDATTGAGYHGLVQVAAFWINPAADDLYKVIPGDQRGITTNGDIKGLTTYGMANVELTGNNGQPLQLAAGKNAVITMPIPASVQVNAPATIPLWYFDEAKGLWIEQGSAIKNGNTYTGEVSHFTIWNLDEPASYVQFDCTVMHAAGYPMKNTLIRIYAVNDPNNVKWAYTNNQGFLSGLVPANTLLRMEVMGDESCGTPLYTQTFNTAGNNISLNTITIQANAGISTVTGTLKNCSNEAVTTGAVIMQKGGQYYRFPVEKNGTYRFTTPICSSTASVYITGYDAATGEYSSADSYTITTGSNNSIDIRACGSNSREFIDYTINGTSYRFSAPLAIFPNAVLTDFYTFSAFNEVSNERTSFSFQAGKLDEASGLPLGFFNPGQLKETLSMVNPVQVMITEHDSDDQYVAGHFSGIFKGSTPAHQLYNISCSFRLKLQL